MLHQSQLPQLVFSVLNQLLSAQLLYVHAQEGGGGGEDKVRVTRNTVMLVVDISVSWLAWLAWLV